MRYALLKNVLNGGEISPLLYARVDQPRYQTGAYTMLNAVPLPQGGVTRRPGTVFCGHAADESAGAPVRLVPFIFSSTQARMLEFSPGRMRVWTASGAPIFVDGAPYELALPYTAEDIPALNFAQSADVMFTACVNRPPAKISRYGDTDWRFEELTFQPKTPTPAAPVLTAGGDTPGSGNQSYSYKIVAVNGDTGELSAPSEAADITASSLSTTYYIDVAVTPVPGCDEHRVYKKKAGVYGFIGRILDDETSLRDNNIGPDQADTPPEIKTPFTGEGDYPSLVFFHQQRLGWAATRNRPLTVWFSRSADFESLSSSVVPRDDDGIEITVAGQNQSGLLWLLPDRDVLLAGTASGEGTFSASDGGVLTPSNHRYDPQSEIGSQDGVGALRAGGGILFIQRGGTAARLIAYSFQQDKYEPQDLSILARHILAGKKVRACCRQAEPYGVVWFCLSDGSLAGLTLLPEHDVIGWHRHATDGVIENIACLPASDGSQDLVWMVVRRRIQDVERRFIEVTAPYFDEDDKELSYFLDAGVSRIEEESDVLGGLGHLEGRKISLFGDGCVLPPRTVENGAVSLDAPARVVHAGLPFSTVIRPTRPEVITENGTTVGRVRRIGKVVLRLHRSLSFKVQVLQHGTPQDAISNRAADPIAVQPRFLEGGDVTVTLGSGWKDAVILEMRADDPVPVTILAVTSVGEAAPDDGGY
jgi:hypothetical protein